MNCRVSSQLEVSASGMYDSDSDGYFDCCNTSNNSTVVIVEFYNAEAHMCKLVNIRGNFYKKVKSKQNFMILHYILH